MSSPELVAVRGGPVSPSRSALRPLGPDEVRITGGFWADKQELNSSVILPHCETWMERVGWTTNFDRVAAGTIGDHHDGIEFVWGNPQLGPDMGGDFGRIIIDEVADLVIGNPAKFCPISQRADGRLLPFGKNPTEAESDYIGKLIGDRRVGWLHFGLGYYEPRSSQKFIRHLAHESF